VCVDSNLNSITVGRDHLDSSLSPLNVTSSRTTLPRSRAKRDAVGTVAEAGQLKQICLTDRNVNSALSKTIAHLYSNPAGSLHST